jgi:nicotinamide-nucleotide amidase
VADVDAPVPDDAALAVRAAALGKTLAAQGLTLAVAESCTGGWIAKALTDVAGSSDWFDRGFVTYSNEAKIEMLGVEPELIAREGAVSEAVVAAMTAGIRRSTDCEAALAVSGVAGPGGGTDARPVGCVCFGWSLGERNWTETRRFSGDREAVRRRTVDHALRTLLAALADPGRRP